MKNKIPGDANRITREYLDSLLLEMRNIGGAKPSCEMTLFGQSFKTPIMTAALSHLDGFFPDGASEMAKGALSAGAVEWTGMGGEEELEKIVGTGAETIKIIKPYIENERVFKKIEHAQKCGVLALGVDLDHSFDNKGNFDVVLGEKMSPKSVDEIKAFVKASDLPFIIKGVLSVTDAKKCMDAGVSGIVVSHHHGRLNYAVPPLMVLPEIAEAVKGQMSVFVDCGIMSGYDAFKALALGADAVCAGRILMDGLKPGGAVGVQKMIDDMTSELLGVMGMTACAALSDIEPSIVRRLS